MLSVVIPVLNGADVLDAQLRALTAQDVDDSWEVLVADNGSTDGTLELARRWSAAEPHVRIVDASSSRGPSAARNAGVGAARGELLLFCDADDVVYPGWMDFLAHALHHADAAVGAIEVGSLNGRRRDAPRDPWPYQFRGYLRAGLAANMAVRRSAFDAVGGFHETDLAGEDIDLCWRLQHAGFTLEYEPRAVVAKRNRAGLRGVVRQGLSYGRGDVALYRRFRAAGMPRDLRRTVRSWGSLLVHCTRLLDRDRRHTWLEAVFIRVGRLVGSIRERTFYP